MSREVNIYVDGHVVATAADEIDARYEGQHLYQEGRKAGHKPRVGYTVRYVMPFDETGVQKVVELALGSSEQRDFDAEYDDAVARHESAMLRAKEVTAKAAQPGR